MITVNDLTNILEIEMKDNISRNIKIDKKLCSLVYNLRPQDNAKKTTFYSYFFE
jgi:hypothetical protein